MMGNQQPLFNDQYPDDVIGLILMQVDVLTLASCSRICRQFARILRSQYFWKCKVASGADPTGTAMDESRDFRRQVFRLVNSPNRRIVTTYAISESREPLIMRIDKREASWEIMDFVSSLNLGVTRYDYVYRKDYEYTIFKRHNYRFDLMEILR